MVAPNSTIPAVMRFVVPAVMLMNVQLENTHIKIYVVVNSVSTIV